MIIRSYIYYAELPKDNGNEQIEVEYQIEQILDHRIKEKEKDAKRAVQTIEREVSLDEAKEEDIEYLVKWMGYEELTWEPAQNLKNAPDVVESYRQEHISNSNMISRKTKAQGKKGKKKDAGAIASNTDTNRGKRTTRSKTFDMNKVFPKPNIKTESQNDEDELIIINKETYQEAVGENKSRAGRQSHSRRDKYKLEDGNSVFDNIFAFQKDTKEVQRDQSDKLKETEAQIQKDNKNQKDSEVKTCKEAFLPCQNDQNNKMPDDYCNQYRNPLSYTSNHNSPQENIQPLHSSAQSPEQHSEIRTMSKDISIRAHAPLEYIENVESPEKEVVVRTNENKDGKKRSKNEIEVDLERYDSVCKISKLNEFIESKSMKGKRKKKEVTVIEIESDTENKIGSYLI